MCALKRSWSEKELRSIAKNSKSLRQIIYSLGLIPAGGNYAQVKKYLQEYRISTQHFTGQGWSKGMRLEKKPRVPLESILVNPSDFQSYKLKKRLFKENLKQRRCEECGWDKLSEDGRIPLELDHINGNHADNRLENLRILCPNCHSLKATHRGKNKKKKI